MSAPSYSRWATDIVRFGLKPSFRLASCWRVEVVNGGAGLRLCLRVPTLVTRGLQVAQRRGVALGGLARRRRRAPRRRSGRARRRSARPSAVARSASIVQYSRAVKALISRSRSTTSRTATDWTRPADRPARTLRDEERAERVADEPVDDPAGLLGVDEVLSMSRGWANASRIAPSVISLKVTRWVFDAGDVGGLGDVPGDRLALAVEVGGEVDVVGALGRLLDLGDLLAAVVGDHVFGREVVVDVDAELALAGVLGQVADVAVGGEDPVVGAEVALDRPRLGGRFDDHEVL